MAAGDAVESQSSCSTTAEQAPPADLVGRGRELDLLGGVVDGLAAASAQLRILRITLDAICVFSVGSHMTSVATCAMLRSAGRARLEAQPATQSRPPARCDWASSGYRPSTAHNREC